MYDPVNTKAQNAKKKGSLSKRSKTLATTKETPEKDVGTTERTYIGVTKKSTTTCMQILTKAITDPVHFAYPMENPVRRRKRIRNQQRSNRTASQKRHKQQQRRNDIEF
jgi:hypothetical protein